ncbi:heme o synthase [Gallaecimonas kandeliae]|uniref:heme o synthase n=1 Tax=Gallaecimonas kandeliae TaxID=3029055 RepID=UPI00264A4D04|nr:heme o synthase [Gallaecimonas kandeliae]WKE65841.1 heme o synthase [Gallaecimonas kandeliae]
MNSLSLIWRQGLAWRDYLELTKPRVVALLLLTALVGMVLASPGWPPLWTVLNGLCGIGLVSAAAAAINHVLDQRIDLKMARTYMRPVARGRVSTTRALAFAALLAVLGLAQLALLVNPLTALLTFLAMLGYAVLYTVFLKRATPQNIVIGGLAGAAPPLLGWTAVTGSLHGDAWLLVMIIFTWTPPHFWALAIARRADYQRAGIPMLPVTHGVDFTKTCILLYTVLLLAVLLLPYLTGLAGLLYLAGALVLGTWFLWHAALLKWRDREGQAMRTFRVSIWQLMLLFLLLLIDHGVGR